MMTTRRERARVWALAGAAIGGSRECLFYIAGEPSRRMPHLPAKEHSLQAARADPLHRVTCDLARIAQFELFLDVRAMGFDRLGAEMQRAGDLLNFLAFADALENLNFTVG